MKVGYLLRSCYMSYQKEIELLLEIPFCRLEKMFTGKAVKVHECFNHFIINRQTTGLIIAYINLEKSRSSSRNL